MSSSALLKFKQTVDMEIEQYEAMDELYKLKQAVLVQGKSDDLWDVDAKIIEKAKVIKEVTSKRKEAAKFLGSDEISISQVIDHAKKSNDEIAKNLESQKTKLNILAQSLTLREKTNLDLIKHGLVMAEKTFNIIVNVVTPKSSEYDQNGNNVKNDKIGVSSVIEEA